MSGVAKRVIDVMQFRSTSSRWGPIAVALHWVMALAILAMLVLGLVMVNYPMSATKLKLFAVHKSIGLTVLALVWVRLAWRCFDRRPGWPRALSGAHKYAARSTHIGLYILMLVVPLSGWCINAASGFPLNWFGLFAVPSLLSPNETLQAIAESVHLTAVIALTVVLSLHVAGALYQQFARRSGLLRRMWLW